MSLLSKIRERLKDFSRLRRIYRDYGAPSYYVPYGTRALWAVSTPPLTTEPIKYDAWDDRALWESVAKALLKSDEPLELVVARALANEDDGCLLRIVLGSDCKTRHTHLSQYALLKARYGKPNQWCWPCWHRRAEDDLQAALQAVAECYASAERVMR